MIRGITEASFLDWDGKIVTVLYNAKCNFKCPFCHNWKLMEQPEDYPEKDWAFIESYLTEHKDFLDGVCLTGGEPTIEKGLEELIKRIKGLGMGVKLDTNGSRPDVLERLLKGGSLDAIAMDVKMPLDERYERAVGVVPDLDRLKQSIGLIRNSGLEHEFRTTVVPTIHTKDDIIDIAKMLEGAERYVLQQFNPKDAWDLELRNVRPYANEEIMEMASACKRYVKEVVIRGLK